MLRAIVNSLGAAHVIATLVVAAGHFGLWKRSGFWLPRYIHLMALAALLIGVWLTSGISPNSPVGHWGMLGQLFTLLICPALVYGFFILHGGPAAALRRRPLQPPDSR